MSNPKFTAMSTVQEVEHCAAFGKFGRLLFPVDRGYYSGNRLGDLELMWYSRPDTQETAMEDLGRAIQFVYEHASQLQVSMEGYSLWGGSAGARMAATLGNLQGLRYYAGNDNIPQAAAVIMQYTGHSEVSPYDAPTYACVGDNDWIANWRVMQRRLHVLTQRYGIPTEFHVYHGLSHGFGLGTGTVAEGWIHDAVAFWEAQCE